jgi:hypothetical protein
VEGPRRTARPKRPHVRRKRVKTRDRVTKRHEPAAPSGPPATLQRTAPVTSGSGAAPTGGTAPPDPAQTEFGFENG